MKFFKHIDFFIFVHYIVINTIYLINYAAAKKIFNKL